MSGYTEPPGVGNGHLAISLATAPGPTGDGVREPSFPVPFACPACVGPLRQVSDDALRCEADRLDFAREEGIWRFLPPERAAHYRRFVREYETVREREERGASDAAYYRALPFADLTGRFSADWRIRARSFTTLVERVLRSLEARRPGPLAILDLGAGNGWLSNRLAERGHQVAALDLSLSPSDGLGAHHFYERRFTSIQAEFDHLPFASGGIDLVIFNGSLHYAADIAVTLAEALRVLRPDGTLVIMDTPVYRRAESGAAMVREREAEFTRRFGFPSNAVPMESFLTEGRLDELAAELGLDWRLITPFYGLHWALRPWKARLRRQREPARFMVMVGRPSPPAAPDPLRRVPPVGTRPVRGRGETNSSSPRTEPQWERRLGGEGIRRSQVRYAWRLLLSLLLPLRRRRLGRVVLEEIDGQPLLVLPEVFNPKLLRSGEILASALDDQLIPPGANVLDMGTGSGIGALAAARWAGRVVAVDINPEAVRCARINALIRDAEGRVEVRQGDLFAPVEGQRFDVVLFNPPYYRGAPRDRADRAWRSPDVVERFAHDLAGHLTPRGAALVILSTDGEADTFLATFRAQRFHVEVVARRDLINEVLTIYRLRPGSLGDEPDDHSL